jgi:predicted SnoaL-like aldol condensation-catalyzing enzyme
MKWISRRNQGTRRSSSRHSTPCSTSETTAAAERFWSPNYVQHSAHIEPGREGLFNLIKGSPASLKYEPGVIVAEGDFVIVHGRFSGTGLPRNWIAADVVRIADEVLAEHWDVLQDEAARAESKSGLPMFGDSFAD